MLQIIRRLLESTLTSTVRFLCRVIINLLFKSNDESSSYFGILYVVVAYSSRTCNSNRVYCCLNDSEYMAPNNCAVNSEREAYFHFIHAFGNGRRSYVSEPITKSVERKCIKMRRRPTQPEFQVTYFANNNKCRYLYCSCVFKA